MNSLTPTFRSRKRPAFHDAFDSKEERAALVALLNQKEPNPSTITMCVLRILRHDPDRPLTRINLLEALDVLTQKQDETTWHYIQQIKDHAKSPEFKTFCDMALGMVSVKPISQFECGKA